MQRRKAPFELRFFSHLEPLAYFWDHQTRRFPSWSTANATDLSALVGALLRVAHEASIISSPMGPKTYKKRNLLRVHTHTHIISSKFGRHFDLVTWIHERCYPGCFLVTRKQDDITVVCAWAMTLDMSSGNTTKCHVLFLYFGGFSCSYLEKQGCFTCFDVFFRRKVEKKHTKTNKPWFVLFFFPYFPLFSHVFLPLKMIKKLPSLQSIRRISRSWQMSQKLR